MKIVTLGIILDHASKVHVLLGLELVKTSPLHLADLVQAWQSQLKADPCGPLPPTHWNIHWHTQLDS